MAILARWRSPSAISFVFDDFVRLCLDFGDFVRYGWLGSDSGELALPSAILYDVAPFSAILHDFLAIFVRFERLGSDLGELALS